MRKPRVVLYDDDAAVLSVLKDFFSLRGYEIISHQRPIACLVNEFADECPSAEACADIIITDYIMPGMNGVELLIAQSRRKCKVPIKNKAIISGFVDEIVLRKLHNLGYAYFEKPFNLDELSAWLDEREKEMDLTKPLGPLGRTKAEMPPA
jgi:DNA-binding NtrC family response regulator